MRTLSILLLLCIGSLSCPAADNGQLVNQTIPAGSANLDELKKAIEPFLTPKGRIVILPLERKIFIQDTPENLPTVLQIARELTAPRPNVRIEVTLNGISNRSQRGVSVGNRPTLGPGNTIRVQPIENNELTVSGTNRNTTTDSLTAQMLLVQNGGTATLEVVRELVVADYFQLYIQQNGLVASVPADFHWEKVGTALQIKPAVSGNYVVVEVTPVLTSLDRGLISLKTLTTTLTVVNGGTVQIGAFEKASVDFNSHFFGLTGPRSYGAGSGAGGSSDSGTFTLKATIEPVPGSQ